MMPITTSNSTRVKAGVKTGCRRGRDPTPIKLTREMWESMENSGGFGGGAAIALPFLLSREGSSSAQVGVPPERLITIYFGWRLW